MAMSCEYCGHKSNEIKAGSGISDTGTRINLHLTDPSDLSRDILKVSFIKNSIYSYFTHVIN